MLWVRRTWSGLKSIIPAGTSTMAAIGKAIELSPIRQAATSLLQELPGLPPFCQVCQLPCALPLLDQNEVRIIEHAGKQFALCSESCQWIFENWPQAYAGRKQFWERYHGWNLADVILDLGYVRPDGATLIGQPALDLERLWTIEDIRRLKYEIKDPMKPFSR